MSDGIERGIYLAADDPRSFAPLALEGGDGDKQLLAEALSGLLDDDEVDTLISHLLSYRVQEDGQPIICEDCGHVRETTEKHPTLVSCDSCGSANLRYASEVVADTAQEGDS